MIKRFKNWSCLGNILGVRNSYVRTVIHEIVSKTKDGTFENMENLNTW
jgi:hypothetical protein